MSRHRKNNGKTKRKRIGENERLGRRVRDVASIIGIYGGSEVGQERGGLPNWEGPLYSRYAAHSV
jgi:hypothetical protein